MNANLTPESGDVHEGYVPVPAGPLFVRQVGQGPPIVVLHGGPDFDHTYLLPDLDRLADGYRLVYYDQRGRGRSPGQVESVSLASELADLDALRAHLGLEQIALLGHSWGGLLAAAYALRCPERVSRLILLNTAPLSHLGIVRVREEIDHRTAPLERLHALRASPLYAAGDPATVAAFYRLRFSTTIKRPADLDKLDLGYSRCTSQDILRAWAIEARLYQETYLREDFDLLPQLRRLKLPSLVLHGDHDFIPLPIAREIADAIPNSCLVVVSDCGHFSYFEQPGAVRRAIDALFAP
jgi:proline iminopeptidase